MAIIDEDEIERAELYRLFARLFSQEPPDEIIYQFKDMFQMRFTEPPQEIRMDFAGLFLSNQLPPQESFYLYPPYELVKPMDKVAEEVEAFYNSLGVMIDEESGLIPDHISAELLFMSYLIENGFLDKQKAFMEKHLLRWIPGFCDALKEKATTTFFKEIAIMLKEFITADYEESLKDYA